MGGLAIKDVFCLAVVREIADDLVRAYPPFDAATFVARSMDGLDGLELTGRAAQIADALHEYLPQPFARSAAVIEAALGEEIPATGENGLAPLRYMPHLVFVQKYGLDDYEVAIRLQAELTKRFSAEFSIRAFLIKYPERTYAQMLAWARDDNAHLRRLASEGTRPRLPWAPRLRAFQQDPRPVIALLELLKDDPERYVQRSVANSLNDIGKDHPELVVEVCRRWLKGATADRQWVVKHALRSLVKKGHRGALETLGAGGRPNIRITGVKLTPKNVELGGIVRFSFEIASMGKEDQYLLIDYAVHFVKANGATKPKVFKLREVVLAPSTRIDLGGAISLAEMTTRRHYPGRHRINALINGVTHPLAEFDVRPNGTTRT